MTQTRQKHYYYFEEHLYIITINQPLNKENTIQFKDNST